MKYINSYEELKFINYSNIDKLVDNIKNKFGSEIEYNLSKYLEPTTIQHGKNKIKAFLFKPDFGVSFNINFTNMPYKTISYFCIVFKEDNKWKRSSYTKLIKDEMPVENFVIEYIKTLEKKYENRKKTIFKKTMKKYNL